MKKIYITAIALLGWVGVGYAQLADNATATINIVNILSITSNFDPTFNIDTQTEFQNGETIIGTGALSILATTNYDVNVVTSGSDFLKGTDAIPVSNVTIDATNDGGAAIAAAALSATAVPIIDEAPANLAASVDLTYVLAGGTHLLNAPDGAYVTTLTFTVSVD